MAGLSNLAATKVNTLISQAQQQALGTSSSALMCEASRQAEVRFGEDVAHAASETANNPPQNTGSGQSEAYPPTNAFYGYGRPLAMTAPQPVAGYAVPTGCTGHAPGQIGLAPCQSCS